jgi:hypothetical protein
MLIKLYLQLNLSHLKAERGLLKVSSRQVFCVFPHSFHANSTLEIPWSLPIYSPWSTVTLSFHLPVNNLNSIKNCDPTKPSVKWDEGIIMTGERGFGRTVITYLRYYSSNIIIIVAICVTEYNVILTWQQQWMPKWRTFNILRVYGVFPKAKSVSVHPHLILHKSYCVSVHEQLDIADDYRFNICNCRISQRFKSHLFA